MLYDPRETIVATNAWGLGTTPNNLVEAYALQRSLQIAKESWVGLLIFIENSMVIIKVVLGRSTLVKSKLAIVTHYFGHPCDQLTICA
jgi:hypothetical protein